MELFPPVDSTAALERWQTTRADCESRNARVADAFGEAYAEIARGCHLQGNEFSVTLKPNHETGTDDARAVIDEGLRHQIDSLERAVADETRIE